MDKTFFILDSYNLDQTASHLYGYAIDLNSQFITHIDHFDSEKSERYSGCFIAIIKDGSNVKIIQDQNGSFGLFCYQSGSYYAISNSFLALFQYLSVCRKIPLSLNKKYGAYFILTGYMNYILNGTFINEIDRIPKDAAIYASPSGMVFQYMRHINKIRIDTLDGLAVIDSWINKYVNLFRLFPGVCKVVDVTGGKDSRISMGLALVANLPKCDSHFYSVKGYACKEDYPIAESLGKQFGFAIENFPKLPSRSPTPAVAWAYAMCFQLGWHGYAYFSTHEWELPWVHITGQGGEFIRSYFFVSPQTVTANLIAADVSFNSLSIEGANSLWNALAIYKKNRGECPSLEEALHEMSIDTLSCFHFGHSQILSFNSNEFKIAPLTDAALRTIDWKVGGPKKDVLAALVSLRVNPALLEQAFVAGARYDEDVLDFAKKINALKSFEITLNDAYEVHDLPRNGLGASSDQNNTDCFERMHDEFMDARFWEIVSRDYGMQYLFDAQKDFENKGKHHPEMKMFKLLAFKYFMNMGQALASADVDSIYESCTKQL